MTTRELIETAFADVPYPGDDNIADHQDCLECDDVRAFFRGKSWRDLKFPELLKFENSLSLLTPEAYLYFLPAYMLVSLENWQQSDLIPINVLSIGGYSDETPAVLDERRDDCRIFNQLQREAIIAYLRDFKLSPAGAYEGEDKIIDFAINRISELSAE